METKNYSTVEIAEIIDVDYRTVGRWIDEGKLGAFITPGGHRRVYSDKLLEFLKNYKMNIPKKIYGCARDAMLVVDDDKTIRDNIEKVLRKRFPNYLIYKAEDGYEAGKLVNAQRPCLVILDLMMPGVDGFKACRDIKATDTNIKVLAISGYDTQENIRKIKECGADGFLAKPFEQRELIAVIESLLVKMEETAVR